MTHKTPKIIKRYQNRKLYDTSDSCYVTLEDISEMIKLGEDVEVIDNETKEDLTAVTLAQIIFEEQKRKTHVLPLNTFTQIIQSGGETIKEVVAKTIETGAREIANVRSFIDDKVRPAYENIQQIPSVQAEIKQLRTKIDALERKLSEHDKKGR
jgi:polyhydroxyalkanoate synthesis repressor PhaR